MFSALWPIEILPPKFLRSRVISDSLRSEPETFLPILKKSRASADTPIPPMPTKCKDLMFARSIFGDHFFNLGHCFQSRPSAFCVYFIQLVKLPLFKLLNFWRNHQIRVIHAVFKLF